MAEENIAELSMPCGVNDEIPAQITQARNRLRGFLTQIHPCLERVLGPRLSHPAIPDLLTRYSSPARINNAGQGHVKARLTKHAPRMTAGSPRRSLMPWVNKPWPGLVPVRQRKSWVAPSPTGVANPAARRDRGRDPENS